MRGHILYSAIIVNMNSYLNFQNFIGYESIYESYNFLMNSHLDPLESDPLTTLPLTTYF
jgi:hypothetical protein